MRRNWTMAVGTLLIAGAWACAPKTDARTAQADSARNLALQPAESTARPINDRPANGPATPATATEPARRSPAKERASEQRKVEPPPPAEPQRQPEPAPSLETGTTLSLTAIDTINTRHNNKGDPVTAKVGSDVKDARGRTVIPAGAVLVGRVSDIGAGHPGSPGRIVLTFSRVQFDGKTYGITAQVDSLATVEKGRSVQAKDAAKVGVGAVLGGIAGRLIGGNKTGTIVGGAAGAAAGAGVAAKTRDVDLVLPAGALVRVKLTAPFELKEVAS